MAPDVQTYRTVNKNSLFYIKSPSLFPNSKKNDDTIVSNEKKVTIVANEKIKMEVLYLLITVMLN